MLDYSARVLADSVSEDGVRLSTLEVVIPRFILAEFNTHRVLSRNSASSRAIPVHKMVNQVLTAPFVPHRFSRNQAGMQASEYWVPGDAEYDSARQSWLEARDFAILSVVGLLAGRVESGRLLMDYTKTGQLDGEETLSVLKEYEQRRKDGTLLSTDINTHKQVANRLLENWVWQTIIASGTEWENFVALREHFDAQDQISIPARLVHAALDGSTPEELSAGQWHMPLIMDDEKEEAMANPLLWRKVSAGRCARVSYLTHEGRRDVEADVRLFERLASGGHMSPLEHVATPDDSRQWFGNFRGWKQYRKFFPNEENYADILRAKSEIDWTLE